MVVFGKKLLSTTFLFSYILITLVFVTGVMFWFLMCS